MLKSMTAYGRGESKGDDKQIVIELKSLNHRFRDFLIRLPQNYSHFESKIKELLSKRFARGRIEFTIRKENLRESENNFCLNLNFLRRYYRMAEEIKKEFNLKETISLNMLLGLKDVVSYQEEDNFKEIWEEIQVVLEKSMDALEKMRRVEGKNIQSEFLKNLKIISALIKNIEKRMPLIIKLYQARLDQRIKDFINSVKIDESRLAQEIAYISERSDISEELVRLKSHIKQFGALQKEEDPVGRKLEFLLQEMNREANTIGSKSIDAYISQQVVELKSELEKMREQVQNIE